MTTRVRAVVPAGPGPGRGCNPLTARMVQDLAKTDAARMDGRSGCPLTILASNPPRRGHTREMPDYNADWAPLDRLLKWWYTKTQRHNDKKGGRKMTVKEMTQIIAKQVIGKVGLVKTGGLEVAVWVRDAKQSYGSTRVLVAPVAGRGETWVDLTRVYNLQD